MEQETITDVSSEAAPPPSVSSEAVSAPAEQSGSEQTTTESEAQAPDEQPTKEAEAPFKVPENDDDLKGQENNPHVQAVIQMRQELRQRDQRLDEFKGLETWKPVVEAIGDPAQAQVAHELVGLLHSPVEGQPNQYSTKPFLDRVDQESPGVANQLFADLLSYPVPDDMGKVDTLVRHLYRSHGLDPDRIEDYRNIDTLRASGVVTADDLSAIPEKYHPAFKALSASQREDILAQQQTDDTGRVSYPAATFDYLQDKAEALEARQWREKDEQAKQQTAQQEQVQFEQQVQQAIYTDIFAEVKTIHDSIYKNLSSQFTFSSDATINSLEYGKIMATLATLQNPAYRFVAENALRSVGVTLNGFDELTNRWEDRRSAYTQFKANGDNLQANRALSEATAAKQQILTKLNDYALRLGKASGERASGVAAQQGSQLEAATARFVPSGTGQQQQGSDNPYMQNPHPVGTQEYYAFNRKIDKEYNLTGASPFS